MVSNITEFRTEHRGETVTSSVLADQLTLSGYAFVPASDMKVLLDVKTATADWTMFATSWNDLAIDTHMADQGRYRRRRHAVFKIDAVGGVRTPHQAHYQALDYNPLNGGIARWFEPVLPEVGASASLMSILNYCHDLFDSLRGERAAWHVEVHQFRIEARADQPGLPTPEGMHRDGVDYVLVLLIQRTNIASGTTMIGADAVGFFSSFTLTEPLDAAFVEDARVFHGVTPVEPIDPALPAYRDVLVVTFRRV